MCRGPQLHLKKKKNLIFFLRNLLSKQQHYDWGLRALKTILGSCGNLFKENRKRKSNDRFTEMELSVEAIRLNTLSKLTFKDSSLLDNIIKDVFTEVKFIGSDFDKLKNALHSSCEELGLQLNKDQVHLIPFAPTDNFN